MKLAVEFDDIHMVAEALDFELRCKSIDDL
jgi:hypothetical protein